MVTVAVASALRAAVYASRRAFARRHPASTLVVAPDASCAARVAALLHARPEYGLRPVGLASPAPVRPAPPEGPAIAEPPGFRAPGMPQPARSARPETPAVTEPSGPAPTGTAYPARGVPQASARAAVPEPPAIAEPPGSRPPAAPSARPTPLEPRSFAEPSEAAAGGTTHRAGSAAQEPPAIAEPPGPHSSKPPPAHARPAAGGPQAGAGGLPAPVLPVLALPGDVTRAVVQNAVRHAVVAGPATLDARTTATVRLLAAQGCVLWHVGAGGGGGAGHLWGHACRRLDPYPPAAGRLARGGKRALDAAVAAVALLCLAPLLAGCALAVRLADGPGVIFRQERIGLHGRPFTLLKFRTLRPSDDRESATRWTVAGDDRMSRAGRLLRRTSLDELPQLWNVLRGDMSLVGPRPERPYFVAQFSQTLPGYADRHRMPAGLTGLAQVHGLRGDTSIADRARFDNHYIDSWSLWQDVGILLRTAVTLFRHGGS
jgi:lipopolysaccharide/colanic/teichoic acid biosynthesis glycosyltransferase